MAKQYEENGIKYLHLVDLDGAKSKTIVNKKVLEEICSKTNLVVDFGGGIKSEQDLKDAFSCGAAKITAGSIAATDKEEVFKWISSYGSDRIVLGADVQDKHVMINGWKTRTDYSINALLSIYIEKGIQEVISTDISVDGMMTGPAIDLYKEIMSSFSTVKLIASGGVGACSDLDELLKIGVDGVIIGKAIYENKISLKELQKYVN
jgi:phosphoribosylformimino-5-aminoimidazole carboxamide ribotide isomerase